MRQRNFTLVELLVVVGIIALLVAMLLPALAKAEAKGKDITCRNNLKQQGLAFHMYVSDNDDWAAPVRVNEGGGSASNVRDWSHLMQEAYQPQKDLFFCPMESRCEWTESGSTGNRSIGYGLNYYLWGLTTDRSSSNLRHPVKLSVASRYIRGNGGIVLGDSAVMKRWNGAYGGGKAQYGYMIDTYNHKKAIIRKDGRDMEGGATYALVDPRHDNGVNYLLHDGHVVRKSVSQIRSEAEFALPYSIKGQFHTEF